ncbi:NAD(P)-binding protein [Mytilinidion resinicola]|uniref:NAD(P)-binding protein n=1 Tax=Mytilinidion resinicola TaxID=574789 RepID=A0A6A6YTG5_9PEZI|nr:NAD(P)-binding protein [Mytilinidion resinicola]KAF2811255.1 NAD(P)-binding protein [Mytilinidion resinicola]
MATESPQTWFITGCSSGFGEGFVRQLRAAGDNVIATGRNAETKLAHLKDTGAVIMDLDVTEPLAEIAEKAKEAWSVFGGVDIVVNNAGAIISGALEELTQEELETGIKTNFYGPLNVTKAFLPYLRERGSGTLLYIGSIAGWQGNPGAISYTSPKFAIAGAVECLAKELAVVAPAIKLLLVEPGYFHTAAFTKLYHVPPRLPAYAEFNAASAAFEERVNGHQPGDVEKGVQRMIELAKGTGMAEGKTLPLRVPLGSDAVAGFRAKCEEGLKTCREWEEMAKSTDKSTGLRA